MNRTPAKKALHSPRFTPSHGLHTPSHDPVHTATPYWNAGTSEVTATVSSNKLIGVAVIAAGAGAATVAVRLNGSF